MISTIINTVLFVLKSIAFATITFLFLCTLVLIGFLILTTHKSPEPKPMLPSTKERPHNSKQTIVEEVLITATTKSQAKSNQKQQTKLIGIPRQVKKNSLAGMTSRELLAYAKQEKIKGYSSVYNSQNKLGLIKLIEQQIEQQSEFS